MVRSFVLCLALFALFGCVLPQPVDAAEGPDVKRILLVHQYGLRRPFRLPFDNAFVETIRSTDKATFELYVETIEPERLSDPDQERLTADYLKKKYAGQKIDVVVAVRDTALAFARQNRDAFGNPPIVALVTANNQLEIGSDITGLKGGLSFAGTIDFARALRPGTETVYMLGGDRRQDPELVADAEARRQLAASRRGVKLEFLREATVDELSARVASLPDTSVILYFRPVPEAPVEGELTDGLTRIVQSARVPVFALNEIDLGDKGILGGNIWRFQTDARRLAEMAMQVAQGTRAREIPPGDITITPMVDWRQLQRWNIPEARLPADTVVLYRTQTFFELYRKYVVGGLLVFAVQSSLIAGLFLQHFRRRRAERKASEAAERYRNVVDTQSELICRFRADTTLTFVNDAYCRFFGRTRESLIGTKFIDFVPPSDREGVLQRLNGLVSGVDSHEHPVTLPDGTTGWHHWVNHAITNDRGELTEFQGVGRDVTDRKRAEEAVGRLEARNTALLRAVPDLMFVLQRDGTYLDCQANDPRFLLEPAATLIGKNVRDVLPSSIAAGVLNALDRACETQETVVIEYELPIGDGRHFEARLVQAGPDRVLSMVRDVTEARRAMQLSSDLAGRLIASQEVERQRIARELHDDVSQKIALLNIEIDQLARNNGDEATKTRLQQLSLRTSELAGDVHDLSHELHPSRLQTLGLVAAIESLCRDVSRQSGIEVSFSHGVLPQPVDPEVSLCLYRITQEALHNVARHSHARQAQVFIVSDNRYLTLQISDSGVGFDAKRVKPGGLGLVSMRERVAFLKGHLWIDSSPGGGTRVGARVSAEAGVTSGPHRMSQPA